MPVEKPAPAALKAMTRLIVLPFRMLRPDPQTDFLAFSLPDALATSLSALSSLVVRSSLAASKYGGGEPDLKVLAAEADVDVVVTGTLLAGGDEIRATAQLTDATNGTLLCSHSTQASTRQCIPAELTERLVDALALPLTAREQRILRQDVPADAKLTNIICAAISSATTPNNGPRPAISTSAAWRLTFATLRHGHGWVESIT